MKMTKKFLIGAVALVAATLSLASCKMAAGEGKTEGDKWDLTMKVDGTDPEFVKAATDEASKTGKALYRRYWKQFSPSEKVAEIKTTVTLNSKEQTKPSSGKVISVTGLMFDLNVNATDNKKVDFNLIGVNPNTRKFYVERYTGVSKQTKESLDTTDGSLVATKVENLETSDHTKKDGWCDLTPKMISTKDGVTTCEVTISQDPDTKKYTVKLGTVTVATYDASKSIHTWTDTKTKKTYAVGGISCYGNVAVNTKLVANYHTEKTNVTGVLNADTDEDFVYNY